jgi:hypothetical protein
MNIERWEYTTMYFEYRVEYKNDSIAEMRQLGQSGWELVTSCESNDTAATLIFKRKLPFD